MRPILATIHLDALRHNLAIVKKIAPKSNVMAVVKANAYGHGLLRVAKGLAETDGFAVLGINEAISLREAGYKQTIMLLEGVFEADELELAAQWALSIVVHNEQQMAILENVVLSQPIEIFLKMNTGMNRLGFRPQVYATQIQRLSKLANVKNIVMMTHFAAADEDSGISEALAKFHEATQTFSYQTSVANSAALLRYPESHTDWVRPGIMLYGATPVSGQAATSFGLKPAMQLTTEIIAVQTLQAGESVGYGHTFTAKELTRVGIVACGYADGYPRHAPSGTPIAINGKVTKTLGRVSMDMLFADISDILEADVGSAVELWGAQVTVDAVAEASGTVGYELLCAVAPRVPFEVIETHG
ncbi:alanine racemase [Methyloradius palustris]|nr:alanine racemase [Methyloradius palustris]